MRNRQEDQMTLVIIRHGATDSNRQRRYLGKTDEALSIEGVRQLAEYKDLQCYPAIDCLFVSPMKRCIQTADILYPQFKPIRIKEWSEMDFGDFEGKNHTELQADNRYRKWIESNGRINFPNGESMAEFVTRCERGFRKMTEELAGFKSYKHKKAGLIVHGGTIMALLSKYYGGEYFDYQTPNAKGYVCTVKDLYNDPKITQITKI